MDTFEFEQQRIYKAAHEIGKLVWDMVAKWDWFARDTMGKQLVRSADSISFNYCEGRGRYFYRDRRLFCYYSRGSTFETFENLLKAHEQNLITLEEFESNKKKIKDFSVRLNNYIATPNTKILEKSLPHNKDLSNNHENFNI